MRAYDRTRHRLIYIDKQATPEFWDDHWKIEPSIRAKLLNPRETLVSKVTRRFLQPADGPILEAGCGSGQHVAALTHSGYRCIGIDSAKNTVNALNQAVPELDIQLGDVNKLQFPSASFAGCWSLGVIEHFWDGFEPSVQEMARVIQPNGYLFITFPYLSPLRKVKAQLRLYPTWKGDNRPEDFYQFALDHRRVIRYLRSLGFQMVRNQPQDGIKGFKSEVACAHSLLQALYDYRGRSLPVRALRLGLSRLLAQFAGHTMLLVFQQCSDLIDRGE